MNGLEIAYERVGGGPPLVFAHGAAADGREWKPQLAALADEFTVVAWDEPGAGGSSDVPADFGLADYANCLAALIEALALGPAHVAGLSWGGAVVQELYRRHPGLVATLILIDTYAGWKGSLPAEEVRARVAGARQMLAAPAEEFDPTLPGLFAGDPPAEFVALLEEVAASVRPPSLRTQLSLMAETDLRDLLPRIAVPTLLIWGELDARSPLSVARQFEQAIPNATLVVIPGSGHVSNLERPDRFNEAVREFCRAHPHSHWDAAYADGDEDRSWTQERPAESLEALAFTAPAPDAPLIDVGGGSSRLAAALLDAGHSDVTVLDLSAAALDLARRRLGPRADMVTWLVADLLTWRPTRQYATWHDRAVLHFFTDPVDRSRYADTLRSALMPGGHAIIAGFAPDGPDHCSGLPVQRSSAQDIADLLGDDFELLHARVREHRTPSGTAQPFTWVIARRTR